jgi:hypothetical protein
VKISNCSGPLKREVASEAREHRITINRLHFEVLCQAQAQHAHQQRHILHGKLHVFYFNSRSSIKRGHERDEHVLCLQRVGALLLRRLDHLISPQFREINN